MQTLFPAQHSWQREINPLIFNPSELTRRLQEGDSFPRETLAKPKLFVIGNDLGKLDVRIL